MSYSADVSIAQVECCPELCYIGRYPSRETRVRNRFLHTIVPVIECAKPVYASVSTGRRAG
jgi:hypothetical protein